MANLGFSKPKKSQFINAGVSTIGAVAGYEAYEMAAQNFPITKEINLGILGGSIVGQAMLKGTGMARTIAGALLAGITINAGITAAEDYGVISRVKSAFPKIASAGELKGLYGAEVEYTGNDDLEQYDLSGTRNVADLM